ncbi:MAG: transcription antitermination factor NusB [Gammaproteobacteria bacterium]
MNFSSPTAASRSQARRAALQALYQWQLTGEEPYCIEEQFLAERPMGKADLIYFKDLLSNVPKQVAALDAALKGLLDRPVEQVDPVERAILRIGAYELSSRPDVPWKTVITEAVKLAKIFGAEQGHRYVNGVLDKLARATTRKGDTAPMSAH